MKLIRFSQGDSPPRFGIVISDRAVTFAPLQQRDDFIGPGAGIEIRFEQLAAAVGIAEVPRPVGGTSMAAPLYIHRKDIS
jgi:hypothetical protein